jgi:hypothetical protein
MAYNFTLDNRPNKKKYTCPGCGKLRKFTRYINSETFEELNDEVGICDRLNSCGYNFTPKAFFEANGLVNDFTPTKSRKLPEAIKPPSFIDKELFHRSMNCSYTRNNFVKHLIKLFGQELAMKLCKAYNVGNSSHWDGANIFWQIDHNLNVRHGQIMVYNIDTFKRTKLNHSVRSILLKKELISDFNLVQCFYGEHLLKLNPGLPIGIVESVKTAIICSVYVPGLIWLATGGANGLNSAKFEVLKGRKITLYPDLNQFDYWNTKAHQIESEVKLKIHVSDLLEKKATINDIQNGFDLADFLLKVNDSGRAIIQNSGLFVDSFDLSIPEIV